MLGHVITDKQRVKAAFAQLRELGFIAKMNYLCCQNCAKTQIHMDHPAAEDLVTYNHQSNDRAFPHGAAMLHDDLVLNWNGDGAQIVRSLESAGLTVQWDGTPNTCIIVKKTDK